ncbi:hypothetical protein CC86DRAFT_371497 [Ophiobolus disseminans]|uniref:MARVEL domain-containing protein n=1 Tax=Ophiobolus disseminans TaxID=1469910 RepID=A0A6A6ZX21_9PLEO|nr:hypothetical protein CC86DRAFT_371497 [Ophiobolus disseminans]
MNQPQHLTSTTPVATSTTTPGHVVASPTWLFVVRIFQSILSFIILVLAADLIHDAYIDELGLALAIALISWLIVNYIIFTERVHALQHLYNIIAVLVLDGLMVILWLATWAAVAAKRAKFIYDVEVSGCYNNGEVVNSKICYKKRELLKRSVVLFKRGQDQMAAVAGLGALIWVLYIVTFVWIIRSFLQARQDGRFQQYAPGGTSATANTTPVAFPSTIAGPASNTYIEEPKIEAQYPQQHPQQHPQHHPQQLPQQLP